MALEDKVAAAISAAVTCYIKSEEEAAAEAAAQRPPVARVSFWAHSGRQAQMEMRRMLQMRLFSR